MKSDNNRRNDGLPDEFSPVAVLWSVRCRRDSANGIIAREEYACQERKKLTSIK